MPGKQCDPDIRANRAYCEGRQAAADGAAAGTNPHPINTPEYDGFLYGHLSWTADPAAGAPQGRDCCSVPFGGGYTP